MTPGEVTALILSIVVVIAATVAGVGGTIDGESVTAVYMVVLGAGGGVAIAGKKSGRS